MNVGWIGTGVMGTSMAGHLLAAGHALTVFSRTRGKADGLLSRGAHWAASPAAVTQAADVVFTMVGFPADVEQVYLGADGILCAPAAGRNRILVDMTTSPPQLAKRLAAESATRGWAFLDAPVSGGDIGARNATLAIMAGGDAAAYNQLLPLFQCLGKNIALMGPAGAGQHTKMCNQIVIAGNMIGMCEALLYAARAGLDRQQVVALISQGAAASWALSNLAPRILKGDLAPGFYVEHFIKDLGIALAECRAFGLELPGLELAHRLYLKVQELGHGRDGTQALILALEALA